MRISRGVLVLVVGLMGLVSVASITASQRGDIRTGPRNPRVEVISMTIDSVTWGYQWVQPQITGGGADVDSYEIEWYVGYIEFPEGDPTRVAMVSGDLRETQLKTDYECPDTFYVHVRVRGYGAWREGNVTPWSEFVTGSVQEDCPLPPMPPPPEGSVDTIRTDTTDLDLALLDLRCEVRPVGYWADRGHPEIPDHGPEVKTQADLRTMSGTGVEWGSRSTLLLAGGPVAEVDLSHGGWQDSVRYVRLGSGFTLPEFDLEPGPDYAVRFEVDHAGTVTEPDEGNNVLTVACPEVS